MQSKSKNPSASNKLTQVKALLPKGESFHDQKGAIVWISKNHILKVEEQLNLFQKMKFSNIQAMKEFMKKNPTIDSAIKEKKKIKNLQHSLPHLIL